MITKHLCENGVRIIHEQMPTMRSVSLGIWVLAGANDEYENEAGLAHFIEHMLFKGTKTETAKSIAEQFDRMGGELNAFTSKEATCFHTTVLQNDGKKAIELLADMVFNSTFEEVEIKKEKSVILEEIAMCEDAPDDEVHEQLWKTMYPDHSLGKPVLGSRESVISFTKKSIDTFIGRLYRPERIVISVAGQFDDALLDEVERLFGSFGAVESEPFIPIVYPSFHAGESVVTRDIEQAHLCIGFPGLTIQDSRQYELAIMDSLLGGGMSSRLFQEVREEKGLGYAIYSYFSSYQMGGSFIVYGGTAPEKLGELKTTIFEVLHTVIEKGVSAEEIQHAKQSVINGFLLGLESVESRMMRNGQQEILLNRHRTVDEVIDRIEQVTQQDVEKLMKEILTQPYASAVIRPN